MCKSLIFLGVMSLSVFMCTTRLAAATDNDTGTLQVGFRPCPTPTHLPIAYGFEGGAGGFGSYSPTGLTGGETVIALFDETNNCDFTKGSWFEVSGFSEDPGAAWMTSVTCNGVTKSQSSAAFAYDSGIGFWSWGTTFGFGLGEGNISCTIVHN